MSKRVGKNCAVKLGSATIQCIKSWNLDGITADQIEGTVFGDNWKSYEFGAKDGGTIGFEGFLDPDDVTGQIPVMLANIGNSDITDLKLMIDNTSYYEPCATTGYFTPTITSNADTVYSYVNVTGFSINVDNAGLINISFEGKVSGCMVLI
jgi:hypothetical protein